MKIVFLSLVFCLVTSFGYAQKSITAEVVNNIAGKMGDSLKLSNKITKRIYKINLYLHAEKQKVWGKYTNIDSIRSNIQRIESQRDSLYKQILDPEKYQIYKHKKNRLISNN